jgi:phosphohistidine phosphatase
MELLLWRHAEAEEATAELPDSRRRLTRRGTKQALRMAGWLKQHRPRNLRILVSPAERCLQTAGALALPYEVEPGLGTTAEVADLLAAAGWSTGETKCDYAVLLVGHQPTLGRLAAFLLSGEEADWSFKKGALWWFSSRIQAGKCSTFLRAVIGPDLI